MEVDLYQIFSNLRLTFNTFVYQTYSYEKILELSNLIESIYPNFLQNINNQITNKLLDNTLSTTQQEIINKINEDNDNLNDFINNFYSIPEYINEVLFNLSNTNTNDSFKAEIQKLSLIQIDNYVKKYLKKINNMINKLNILSLELRKK